MTLLVNSLFGQKQEASLFDVHLGTRSNQVLMHCGTVFGHGAEGAGLDSGETPLGSAGEPLAGGISVAGLDPGETMLGSAGVPLAGGISVAVAVHSVQIVETEVTVIVETVLEVVMKVEESEVMVLVTGQVVSVT